VMSADLHACQLVRYVGATEFGEAGTPSIVFTLAQRSKIWSTPSSRRARMSMAAWSGFGAESQ